MDRKVFRECEDVYKQRVHTLSTCEQKLIAFDCVFCSRALSRAANREPGSDLNHAELHAPGFADHVLVPRRIPDQWHVGFVNVWHRAWLWPPEQRNKGAWIYTGAMIMRVRTAEQRECTAFKALKENVTRIFLPQCLSALLEWTKVC
jgi:hypothetical protein